MDKLFWQTIQENNYAIPLDHTPTSLTSELFKYLGSTDPELRDEIAYVTFANFLKLDYYSEEEIAIYIASLLANLEIGIGEVNTDSVFLRSFSALFLAEIVHNDNREPRLKKAIIKTILEKGLWYLDAERDLRGYVLDKGWAHALAHVADLFMVLGKNMNTSSRDHNRILHAISKKLVLSSDWVYHYGEDDRLSRAAVEILRRETLSTAFIKKWLESMRNQNENERKLEWTKEDSLRAFFNVRNFLRSLYLQIITEDELPLQELLERMVLESIQKLRSY